MVGDRRLVRLHVVGGDVTDRPLAVGQEPVDRARRGERSDRFVGYELVRRRTPEVAVGEVAGGEIARARHVELQRDLAAVVDKPRLLDSLAGHRDRLADPVVEGVVHIGDRLGHAIVVVLEGDRGQPIAVVIRVEGLVVRGVVARDPRARDPVSLVVVRVIEGSVGSDLVVGAGGIAAVGAIAVGVEGVALGQ